MDIEIGMWVLAGGILGWIGYAFMGFNQSRGIIVSVLIGAIGGFVGGKLIAPLFTAVATAPDGISFAALLIATVVAAAFLLASSVVHSLWGV